MSELNNNGAYLGGAIYLDLNSFVNINDTDFLSNGAWWGGAISTIGAGKLKVSNSFFNSNSSNGFNDGLRNVFFVSIYFNLIFNFVTLERTTDSFKIN